MRFIVAADTDVGISKQSNQDSLCIKCAETSFGPAVMAMVCDGMGGLEKGELASAVVVRAFDKWFEKKLPEVIGRGDWELLRSSWETMLRDLNKGISEYGSNLEMMLGTTFCAMLIIGDRYMLFNVGDSRAYRLAASLEQLTEDQTYVQREINRGNLTPEQALTHPKRSVLLQCVGASRVVVPDVQFGSVRRGENYMICSDGFRHVISEEEIMAKLNVSAGATAESMKRAIRELIETVKARRERDNISALVIHVE